MSGSNYKWNLLQQEHLVFGDNFQNTLDVRHPLLILLRVRNERLILKDTLDHLSEFADVICAYDDASTDGSLEILKAHKKVSLIISNSKWLEGFEERLLSETRHRGLLLYFANNFFNFDWCMCCDADERFLGPIREFVISPDYINKPDGVRISLFDAYMTDGDDRPFVEGEKLLNFRRFFGPERRDILMMWKNSTSVRFVGLDAREPAIESSYIEVHFHCQHYGKSLSYSHWEETCEYYAKNFPWDTYGKKWNSRRGKALHSKSDFGSELYEWSPLLFANAVKIH